MPKMKTNRGAMKRFKKTASGLLKFRRANRNHILTKKATIRKRQLRSGGQVSDCDVKAVKRLMVQE